MSILENLKDTYARNPAECLKMLPELFDQIDKTVIELPCSVGDTVYIGHIHYRIYHMSFQRNEHRSKDQELRFYASCISPIDTDDITFWVGDIGKTVFLSESDAKAALEVCATVSNDSEKGKNHD